MALSPTLRILLIGLTGLLSASGLALLLANTAIFDAIFRWQLVLSPESSSFPMWQKLPEPMTMRCFLFQVLNPDEVSKGAKPQLEQVGPWVFTEQHEKVDLVWSPNGTVTYRQIRTWRFQPHLSNGSLEDQVTILNSVAATVGAMVEREVAKIWRPILDLHLTAIKERLFVTKSVGEILFDGFHDPLFDELDSLPSFFKKFVPPGLADKFAFFYQRNGSSEMDGVWNVFTGAAGVERMGEVHSWNYDTQDLFPSTCGLVSGSAGEFYTPHLAPDTITLYSNDLCRSIRLPYRGAVEVKGIPSLEFRAGRGLFDNGTLEPANSCYQEEGALLRTGVYNTSRCRFGAPVFISQPHFHQADPWYRSRVDGLSPDPELHDTYFRVEPSSGVPTDVTVRIQLSVLVAPVSGISMLSDVQEAFFPVLWFENSAGVPDNLAFQLKLLGSLPDILAGMGWGQVGLACSIVIIAAIVLVSRRKEEEDTCPILSQSLAEENIENVLMEEEED